MWQNSDKVGQLSLGSCAYLVHELLCRVNGEGSWLVFNLFDLTEVSRINGECWKLSSSFIVSTNINITKINTAMLISDNLFSVVPNHKRHSQKHQQRR